MENTFFKIGGLFAAKQNNPAMFETETDGYFLLNIGYTFVWKNVAILDVMSIALGFILRVYAGSFVINVHMDVWFLLTVVSISLFLAVGKRGSEMTLLGKIGKENMKMKL